MSVCACDGEMRGGWREEGVLVSLKSLTHRIGMTSLPKKPGSLLLLFRSQTHSLLFSPFFPSGLQELLSVGGFQHNHFQNRAAALPFLFHTVHILSIHFTLHANMHQCRVVSPTNPHCARDCRYAVRG